MGGGFGSAAADNTADVPLTMTTGHNPHATR